MSFEARLNHAEAVASPAGAEVWSISLFCRLHMQKGAVAALVDTTRAQIARRMAHYIQLCLLSAAPRAAVAVDGVDAPRLNAPFKPRAAPLLRRTLHRMSSCCDRYSCCNRMYHL